jgi:hypothetical protein
MHVIKKIIWFTIAVALGACGTEPSLTQGEEAALAKEANTLPICTNDADCSEKWSRAVAWVSQNSVYKIKRSAHYIIETYGPSPSGTHMAFTVTREALSDGTYQIKLKGTCRNWLGCDASEEHYKAVFNYYVTHPKDAAGKN